MRVYLTFRPESGEIVDPASYYFRVTPTFETADTDLAWLNGIIAAGTGAPPSRRSDLQRVRGSIGNTKLSGASLLIGLQLLRLGRPQL